MAGYGIREVKTYKVRGIFGKSIIAKNKKEAEKVAKKLFGKKEVYLYGKQQLVQIGGKKFVF